MKRSHEAWRSADLFDSGYGYLVVSWFKADGRVEAGFFLLDVFCLGVKDASFLHFIGKASRLTPTARHKSKPGRLAYLIKASRRTPGVVSEALSRDALLTTESRANLPSMLLG